VTNANASEIIKRILGAYPTQRQRLAASDILAMTVAYTAGLIDLDFELACAAVERCSKTSRFIPTIAEIRAEVGEIHAGQRRSGAEAWTDVRRAISKHGIYQEPVFADPLVADAVASIGWRNICNAPETVAATREDFAKAYDRLAVGTRKLAQMSPGGVTPSQLGGRTERAAELGAFVAGLLPQGDSDA
jgi:hypothetical protein